MISSKEEPTRNIAEEILNDQNCSIIGIDGGWGSGKSNLVGMVEKELTDESNPGIIGLLLV